MSATTNDDHILAMMCHEFAQRHTIVLRLMALKNDGENEIKCLCAALQRRRDAIDALQRLDATTIAGHRAKARVALDIMGPASNDDADDEFIRSVLLNFITWEAGQ
jgi:hypothetical protein